jgi:tetratricopeptide (TPR) repeat protein
MKSNHSLGLISIIGASLFLLGLAAPMAAQNATPPPGAPDGVVATVPGLQALLDAIEFRKEMTAGIISGAETADAAVARLKAQHLDPQLQIDPDGYFALAASDVGERLVPARKGPDAQVFFLAARKALAAAINNTPDARPTEKAQYLSQLAFILYRRLNAIPAAKAAIEQAIALDPTNENLVRLRAQMASEHASIFTAATKG